MHEAEEQCAEGPHASSALGYCCSLPSASPRRPSHHAETSRCVPSPLEDKNAVAIAASCCMAFAGRPGCVSCQGAIGDRLLISRHVSLTSSCTVIITSSNALGLPPSHSLRRPASHQGSSSICVIKFLHVGTAREASLLGASDASRALLGSAIWPSTICASASISPRPRILPTPPRPRSSRDCALRLRRLPSSRGTRQPTEVDLETDWVLSKPSVLACAHSFCLASPSAAAVEQTALRRLGSYSARKQHPLLPRTGSGNPSIDYIPPAQPCPGCPGLTAAHCPRFQIQILAAKGCYDSMTLPCNTRTAGPGVFDRSPRAHLNAGTPSTAPLRAPCSAVRVASALRSSCPSHAASPGVHPCGSEPIRALIAGDHRRPTSTSSAYSTQGLGWDGMGNPLWMPLDADAASSTNPCSRPRPRPRAAAASSSPKRRSPVKTCDSAHGPQPLSRSLAACVFSASCTAARVDSGVAVPLRGCCMWVAILDAGSGLWTAALGDGGLRSRCSLAGAVLRTSHDLSPACARLPGHHRHQERLIRVRNRTSFVSAFGFLIAQETLS
ncbi:hypothetical protein HETIRDRAFT_473832 [Heterobasidion irregulare TC 32-1]|uniref:Uncharacterized protein n=1 Tax=Heterobasidion irregulare (strain TC 32-1) TaxID=747525 RepID=W4KA66_HETIT|nr:uncharacterized protein HETIRDRAFT_473832 [Heterobasidion irregulare TC 32-1]ETW82727.1 hypothetical protein HETIRDRAFT_473832 [Heterobasidion irregulare TC 32-1]